MVNKDGSTQVKVEVKARIPTDLYNRLVIEAGFCGCSLNNLITTGIAREVGVRRMRRQADLDRQIELGFDTVNGGDNA